MTIPIPNRISWIDSARGFCMIAILYFHTEIYYTNTTIIPYSMYVVNALVMFFFISGFLFYKENNFHIKQKIKSIFRTLIKPYFIFTAIISIPKAIVHGENIEIINIIKQILLGHASWFIAALIIAEFIFSIILYFSKEKISIIQLVAVSCFAQAYRSTTPTYQSPGMHISLPYLFCLLHQGICIIVLIIYFVTIPTP